MNKNYCINNIIHHSIFTIRKSKGFTLIELLIVVTIIGVLSSLLMVNFIGIRQRARDGQRKADLRQIQSALELYRADNAAYPCFAACGNWDIASNLTALSSGTTIYMKDIPQDPLSKTACPSYLFSSDGTSYTIFTQLENTNDADYLAAKSAPSSAPTGQLSEDSKSYTVSGGTCSGNTYNFWLNNP